MCGVELFGFGVGWGEVWYCCCSVFFFGWMIGELVGEVYVVGEWGVGYLC